MKYGVVILAALIAVGAAAPTAARSPAVLAAGVSVAGVEVGGQSSESARALVRESFSQPIRIRYGTESWPVSPQSLGVQSSVDEAVARALDATPGEAVKLRVALSGRTIRAYVRYLNGRFSEKPTDARLVGTNGLRPVIAEGKPGRMVARWLMEARIKRALRSGGKRTIALATKPVAPQVTRKGYGPVVVVGRASHRLRLYKGPKLVRQFGVATGQSQYPTPLGTFTIATKQRNPWWIPPPDSEWAADSKPIPPGPGNPLGTRWMGLDRFLIGIHATPDAASIGYSASHGCVRMRIPDAEWLFDKVDVGTPVLIVEA